MRKRPVWLKEKMLGFLYFVKSAEFTKKFDSPTETLSRAVRLKVNRFFHLVR